MNADQIKFRASSIGHIMTEPKAKGERLSETCKKHLTDVFVSAKYGRRTDISNRYTIKGLQVEEDSITLYSRVKKNYFLKNEERLENKYISGTPDLYMGESIQNADIIIDIKSSWDIFTFFRNLSTDIKKQYYWQLQSYMALTGAKTSKLVYCLVDTPYALIEDEKRKLMWKMNAGTMDDPDYVKACAEIEKNLTYPDIPFEERYIEIDIERNDNDILRIYNRVEECREYMNQYLFKLQLA